MPVELDPATYGLTIWDLDREFLTGGVGGAEKMQLGDLLGVLRDAYCRTIGVEYMHIQDTEEQRWIQAKVEGAHVDVRQGREAPHPRAAQRRRGVREVPRHQVRRHQALRPRGRRVGDPDPRRDPLAARPTPGSTRRVLGMAHRGRLNVLSNIIGKSYDEIFQEFEGHVDPTSVQGSGDVKYHLGATGKYESPIGRRHPHRAGRQPEPPRDRRPDRDGHGPRQPGPDRAARLVPGAADPDPRRRGVRRPGRRRRVPGDERHQRLPRRRHDPPDHQQPDRVHDGARVRPLVAVLQRRRQDGAGADLPRQRRRSRGVRAGRPAGVRVPPAVPQGRRHRHGVLPAPRPQRGRRPELHAAADVQGDRRAPQRAQAVRRGARQARRHHRSTRPSRRSPTSRASCRSRSTRPGPTRPRRCKAAKPPKPLGVLPHVDDRRRARRARPRSSHQLTDVSRGLHASTPSWPRSSRPAPSMYDENGEVDWATAEALGVRFAGARGHAGPPRRRGLAAAARSASATPR